LADRVSLAGASDFSVQKRQDANALFWAQVEDSPIIGVGFGKKELLTFVGRTTEIEQGFHNSWLFLLAGGGAITVTAFVLVLAVYLRDVWRRIKGAVWPYERVLLIWSVLMLFTLLLNAIAEPLFSFPSVLLTIWLLLFLPGIVPLRERDPVEAEATAELPLWSRPTRFQRLRIASSSRASSSAH
jgi:O-antigen ligase